MEYAIKTHSLFAQKLLGLLSYFSLIQIENSRLQETTREEEIAENIALGYREMQELQRKGEKGRDAFELLAELRKEI